MKFICISFFSLLFLGNILLGQQNKQSTVVNDSSELKTYKLLENKLTEIYKDDQESRKQLGIIINKYGFKSTQSDSLQKVITYKDSINLVKVKNILDEYGWLGKDKIGLYGNQAIFLVIQHTDTKTQEKYLPMMREAVNKGNAAKSALPLLEDRVLLANGKKQIYGSQLHFNQETKQLYLAPLEDPDNVDVRRSEMNLSSLAEYLKQYNVVWDVEEYKKQLPNYEKWDQELYKKK